MDRLFAPHSRFLHGILQTARVGLFCLLVCKLDPLLVLGQKKKNNKIGNLMHFRGRKRRPLNLGRRNHKTPDRISDNFNVSKEDNKLSVVQKFEMLKSLVGACWMWMKKAGS